MTSPTSPPATTTIPGVPPLGVTRVDGVPRFGGTDLVVAASLVIPHQCIYIMIQGDAEKRRLIKDIQILEVTDEDIRGTVIHKTTLVPAKKMAKDGTLLMMEFSKQFQRILDLASGNMKPVSLFIRLMDVDGNMLPTGTQFMTEGDFFMNEETKSSPLDSAADPKDKKKKVLVEFHGTHPKGIVVTFSLFVPSFFRGVLSKTRIAT